MSLSFLLMIKIYPYKIGSGSARALADALATVCIKEQGRYRPKRGHVILNWGNPRLPTSWDAARVSWINPPGRVVTAGDKLASYRILGAKEGVNLPEFTTDRTVAQSWLAKSRVCGRSLLHASGGRGLTVHQPGATLLGNEVVWCKYITKKREYRVHVFNGAVIDTQIKRKRNGVEHEDTYIRNLENGWVFCRTGVVADPARDAMAVLAVESLGLNFGAVDMIWSGKGKKNWVLEINTAPGLEGTTLESYTNAVRNLNL